MKFEPMISGTRVTDFQIKRDDWVFSSQLISLDEVIQNIHTQKAMNWILDTLRFTKAQLRWWATIDHDSILKLTIIEHYPEYEAELKDYFGEDWMMHYIRFNH